MVKRYLFKYRFRQNKNFCNNVWGRFNIFNQNKLNIYDKQKHKFVTHHWSSHHNKGFEIYTQFDELLEKPEYKNIEFKYIGNIPEGKKFKNIIVKEPLSGIELAKELKKAIFI